MAPQGPATNAASDAPAERWIVGFEDLEAADVGDGEWQGHAVVDTNDAIEFAIVEVRDHASFHSEDRHGDNVDYVEREDPTAYKPTFTPDDPRYDDQYGFRQIDAPTAWDRTLGIGSVNVSVLDTGIDQDHEDLQGEPAKQRDFVSEDDTAEDNCGHGTHTAGTVSANTDNDVGVAGTAGGVDLFVGKVLSDTLLVQCTGSASDIADGITWSTDNGADVISMSLGSSSPSSTIGDAVDYAWDNGVLLVAAAGNDGPCTDCVNFPAAREKVVAVTCTNENEAQCGFSSQGPEAELAAPGNDVLSTNNDGGYLELDGTSMSAPHVSGAAALALSEDPSLAPVELRDKMNSTAQDLGDAGHDNVFGHGEVDVDSLLDSVDASGNDAPVALFDASCEGLTCTFDASDTYDVDGTVSSFDWSFGDGNAGSGEVVQHTYGSAGTFTVDLTATDDDGATAGATRDANPIADALFDEDFDLGTASGFTLSGLWSASDACEVPTTPDDYLGYTRDDVCTYETGDRNAGNATFSVDLSSVSQATLAFDHRWETESTSCGVLSCVEVDHMRVQASTDGGSTWTTIDSWNSVDANQLSWSTQTYSLDSFTGQAVDLRFSFDTEDDISNDFEGWFVDDVSVTSP